jgi:hypothetical protein
VFIRSIFASLRFGQIRPESVTERNGEDFGVMDFPCFDSLDRDSRHGPIERMIAVAHNDKQLNGEGSANGRGWGER